MQAPTMCAMTNISKTRQQGGAALLVVAVLAIVMAAMTLTTTNVGVMEQRIVGNDLRAKEAREAAEAGLEYGMAWAAKNSIPWPTTGPKTLSCPGGTGCPTLPTVTGSSTGENYSVMSLVYKKTSSSPDFIEITATAAGTNDATITATTQSYIQQFGPLFSPNAPTPPPWVVAGCIETAPTGTPDTYVRSTTGLAVITGSPTYDPSNPSACLPQGHLDVSAWNDANGDGVMQSGEVGASTTFNRGQFSGCPSTNCAWNQVFNMPLSEAKAAAATAGHEYSRSNIPGGPASSAPSIYVINESNPINSPAVIGGPQKPVVLIIPSAYGCPKFNGGITIYGIVYYESTTACEANGWGGAKIYGSVIWEGDVDKPTANSEFIETDYGGESNLNAAFNFVDAATRIPGTWKDF
jgi:Tfp pilus assembly protein PilX